MFERRFIALVAGVLAVAAATAVLLLSGDGDDAAEDGRGLAGAGVETGNAAEYFDDRTDTLLYKSGTTLIEKSVDGDEKKVAELDALSVFPSPASPWLAYHATPSGRDDAVVLTLFQTESEEEVDIEDGLGPVWSHDGSHVAYVVPENPGRCLSLAQCRSDVAVAVWDVEAGESVEVAAADEWAILGWSGSAILLAGDDDPTITAVSLDGAEEEIDVAPDDLLAPSPDGRWLFVRRDESTALVPTGGGDEIAVDFPRFDLVEAAWTHRSDRVLAIASPQGSVDEDGNKKDDKKKDDKKKDDKKKKKKESELAQLVTFSPDEPFPVLFEESYGVFGDLMWAPGDDYAAFGRQLGDGLLDFVYCPVEEGDCVSLMAYGEGTFPLRLQ